MMLLVKHVLISECNTDAEAFALKEFYYVHYRECLLLSSLLEEFNQAYQRRSRRTSGH
jgi:hypothetical protein